MEVAKIKGNNKNIIFLIIILVILSIVSLLTGVQKFTLENLLLGKETQLLIISRIPRLVSILVTGASLGIAGIIVQTISSNKFVSPSTIGTMDWAKFGIMISLIFLGDKSTLLKMTVAFIFALFGTMLFMKVLSKMKIKNVVMIPLIGIMLGNVVNSITGFVAYKFDLIQSIGSWMQGNFALVVKGRYELIYIGIPFFVLAYIYTDKFTIVGIGKDFSDNLGLNREKITFIGLIIVSVITASIVVTIGTIPYVGLIIPNIVSIYKGDNMKKSLPDTAILGALFVLICDIAGRIVMYPYEVSISVIMSIVGSLIFLILVFRRYKYAN
jgi:uncharacterized ABC transporter permease protein yclN